MLTNQIYNHLSNINSIRLNQPINIAYDPTSSLFDKSLELIDWANFIDPQTLIDYQLPYYKNIISDGLNISDQAANINYNSCIVLFHHQSYARLKREDASIIDNTLQNYQKICFSSYIQSLNLKKTSYLKYGIPNLNYTHHNEKDVILINLKNNKATSSIYTIIKNRFKYVDILTDKNLSLDSIYEIIGNYKVCIDLDNYYNLLVGCYCGAYGLTNIPSQDPCIVTVTDTNGIIKTINLLLDNYNTNNIDQYISTNYAFDEFSQILKNYIYKI